MAYLIATANGNLTDAATWGAVDATSLLDSEATTVTSTTAYVESATFTPGAITVDGIAMKIASRSAAGGGTVSWRIAQAGVTVAGTEVTINQTDIQNASTTQGTNGWYFMKFAAPVTLLAATLYTVSQKSSVNTTVTYYRNATAGNVSRMLRTTTTAAPAAGDSMFILAEWTAAATKTNRSVTMNETATTAYGGSSTTLSSFGIGYGGTLAYANTAATNYVLRLAGVLDIWHGGTLTIGTATSPIPRSGSAVLEFACAADGDFGIRAWGAMTFTTYGESRTSGKNVVQCLLNTDEAIGQTVLGVDTDTGWLNGDEIAIASTTQTATQAETGTLSGDAAATTVTIGVAITAAHGGSASTLVQAEVILLTRNVRVRSTSSTFMSYMNYEGAQTVPNTAAFTFGWTDFRYLGSAAAAKTSILLTSNAWPLTITATYCCFRDSEGSGINYAASSSAQDSTLTLTDCVFYRVGIGASTTGVNIQSNANASVTSVLTRVTSIGDDNAQSSPIFYQNVDATSSFTLDGVRISSHTGKAISIAGPLGTTVTKRIVNCNVHCMGTAGLIGSIVINSSSGLDGLTIDNCVIWRTVNSGSSVAALAFQGSAFDVVISNCTFFGNSNAHICIGSSGVYEWKVRNCVFAGDSTFATTRAFTTTQSNIFWRARYENCTFGVATGIRVAHATDAVNSESGANTPNGLIELTFVNCNIADATEVGTNLQALMGGRSFIVKQRKDQVTNTHEIFYPRFGTVAYEATTFRTAAPSQKMTPIVGSSTYFRLRSAPKTYPVASGKKITFNVYVQKDGSYNGSQPRLVLLANPALGIDDDTTLDTLSISSGSWELLTGQMSVSAEEAGAVQAVVECDGSAGNVYVDDWSAATN